MLKRRFLLSFMLVLALMLGITAMAFAISPWDNNQVHAASVQQFAGDNAQAFLGSVADHGGGGVTSTLDNHTIITIKLTTVALGEEGFSPVPRYPLIKPISVQSGNLNNRLDSVSTLNTTNPLGQKTGGITIIAPTDASRLATLQSTCSQGSTRTMHLNKGAFRTNEVSPDGTLPSGTKTLLR